MKNLSIQYEILVMSGLHVLCAPEVLLEEKPILKTTINAVKKLFDIRKKEEIPKDLYEQAAHVLSIASLGVCAGKEKEVKDWIINLNISEFPNPHNLPWDQRIINDLYKSWLSIFKKDKEIKQIPARIERLRKDQNKFEPGFLDIDKKESHKKVWKLISLYNWSKATELIAYSVGTKFDKSILKEFRKFINSAYKAEFNYSYMVLFLWLEPAGCRIMIKNE